MLHALAPRHFRNVDQAFDSGLQFDKGAVIGEVDNLAVDARARRIDWRTSVHGSA